MSGDKLSNIKSQFHYLRLLCHCKDKYRKALLENGDKDLIKAICECVFNVLNGNIKLPPKIKEKLVKSNLKSSLRKLIEKSPLKEKKEILIQKGFF
jgi:hypothetical protein